MKEREDRITAFRQRQPLGELERKAFKARRRAYWTQEDLDAATARARQIIAAIDWD